MNENQQELILNSIETTLLSAWEGKRKLTLEAGENLAPVLNTKEYFYFIIEGRLKISQINFDTAKEQTLYLLSRGDMLDIVTLLDGKNHDYVGVVLERCEFIEIPIDQVRQLLDSDAAFKQLFFPYLAKQLRSMEDLAVDLSLHTVYQRLIKLFSRFLDQDANKAELRLINDLSHEELASMVGSVRKVVNRSLQELKKEGIIDISRKHLQLSDLQKLLDKLQND